MSTTAPKQRLTDEILLSLLGRESFDHLRNKTKGGSANAKGTLYEQIFGAHRVARLARKLIELGEDAVVQWQDEGFVDDVVVRRDCRASIKAYQLKNAMAPSWTSGKHPICIDFAKQRDISVEEGYSDIRLRLVCSDLGACTRLNASVPSSVKAYSKAVFFPYSEKIDLLLYDYGWMADDFGFLSRNPNPTIAEVSVVAQVMVGAWVNSLPEASVRSVIDLARSTNPTVLRTLQTDKQARSKLSSEAAQILDGIPHFSYSIERGFLHWTALQQSTSGVLPFDCFDARFEKWQKGLLKHSPKCFEDIEVAL